MLTSDQTMRFLRVAAECHPGDAATVTAFLLALDDRITFEQVRWLDVHNVEPSERERDRVMLRLPWTAMPLPSVVAERIAEHLAAYPTARQVETVDGTLRVPLIRTGGGGRLHLTEIIAGLRHIALDADQDIRIHAQRLTPTWLPAVDLELW